MHTTDSNAFIYEYGAKSQIATCYIYTQPQRMQTFIAKSNPRPYDGPISRIMGSYETSTRSTLSEINSEIKETWRPNP
jgi:hypothetical protein